MKYICTLLFATYIQNVQAEYDWWSYKLHGEIGVGHTSLADPDPSTPLVAYIVIKGREAERLYKKIKVQAEPTGIFSTNKNAVQKTVGNLKCIKNEKLYWCDIGINLETGESQWGRPD